MHTLPGVFHKIILATDMSSVVRLMRTGPRKFPAALPQPSGSSLVVVVWDSVSRLNPVIQAAVGPAHDFSIIPHLPDICKCFFGDFCYFLVKTGVFHYLLTRFHHETPGCGYIIFTHNTPGRVYISRFEHARQRGRPIFINTPGPVCACFFTTRPEPGTSGFSSIISVCTQPVKPRGQDLTPSSSVRHASSDFRYSSRMNFGLRFVSR